MKDPFNRLGALTLLGLALLPYEVHVVVMAWVPSWSEPPERWMVTAYFWSQSFIALVSSVAAASLVARTRFLTAVLAGGLVLVNALLFLGMGCAACATSGQ